LLAALLCTRDVQAVLSTSSGDLSNPAVIDFSQFLVQTSVNAGIQVGGLVGEDVFLTAVGDARVGPMNHGLGDNGFWSRSGALSNDLTQGAMTFTFNDGPVSGVGGFTNYCTGSQFGCTTSVLIEALDNFGAVLEGYDLAVSAPISTPAGVDAGAFRGIVRPTADIYALRLSYGFHVIDDLAFTRVPEPSSAVLCIVGVAAAGLSARRRGRSVVVS
jgi:hypothetical protein